MRLLMLPNEVRRTRVKERLDTPASVYKTMSMVEQWSSPSSWKFSAQPQHNNCRDWSGIVGDLPGLRWTLNWGTYQ